jgi:hypothetical protein
MRKTSTETKQRWNESHYTQIKVSVDPQLAVDFKRSCADAGVSMASVLSAFMKESAGVRLPPPKEPIVKTRKHRRNEVACLIMRLEAVLAAEEAYRDSIPDNLKSSPAYEAADQCTAILEEALNVLLDAY